MIAVFHPRSKEWQIQNCLDVWRRLLYPRHCHCRCHYLIEHELKPRLQFVAEYRSENTRVVQNGGKFKIVWMFDGGCYILVIGSRCHYVIKHELKPRAEYRSENTRV